MSKNKSWIPVKKGYPLPDFDHPVLWHRPDGLMFVSALDKDGNPWLNMCDYWKELPGDPPPQSNKPPKEDRQKHAMQKENFEKKFWHDLVKYYAPGRMRQHYEELETKLKENGLRQ